MKNLRMILTVLLVCALSSEGKKNEAQRILPIEVLLNPQKSGKSSSSGTVIKGENKAIELQIRSDDGKEGGKVDLIIAATKEVQATEQTIDRYSPAFNAEHDFVNEDTSQGLKPTQAIRNWDTSRQDSSFFYPSQSGEVFPYLTLRSVLQSSHPLILEQNQFSPLQNLRHFEDNLQRQMLPHMNPGIGSFHNPMMGVVVSQPILTAGISSNLQDQQRVRNAPQNFNGVQQGLLSALQQHNQNLHTGIPQQNQNQPLNRFTLVNSTPPDRTQLQNGNSAQNNGQSYSPHRPLQYYSGAQRGQSPQNNLPQITRSVPELLGSNKQPIPLHNRPEYTLGQNYENINVPSQRNQNQHQPALRQHNDPHRNVPLNNGMQNNQLNYNLQQSLPYHPIANQQAQLNLYQNPQQTISQHRPLAVTNSVLNSQQNAYHPQNVDPNRINTFQEKYRPPISQPNTRTLPINQHELHYSSHPTQGLSQHSPPNNYQNPSYRNAEQITKVPEDDRNIPIYHRSPEGSRPLLQLRSVPHALENNHQDITHNHQVSTNSQRQNPTHSGLEHHQSHFSPVETENSRPQINHESSYRNPHRSTAFRDTDLSGQADEAAPKRRRKYKSDEDYDSSPTPRRRKLKSRKRAHPKEADEDLEGHSSHQYIIKIG